MSRIEIERNLVEPDYCPGDGQCDYYFKNECWSDEADRMLPYGIVVEYRRYLAPTETEITDTLQSFFVGTIGE